MKQRILYLDCFAGISGDMAVGALLDLGVDLADLQKQLASLSVDGFEIELKAVEKNGIRAQKFNVHLTNTREKHRHLAEIITIIRKSTFNQKVQDLAIKIFAKIASAEAQVHNQSIEEIHFHEVGAIDSIIDILSVAYCIDQLKIDHIYSSPIACGQGFVNCAHGKIPVPVPATLDLLRGIPINFTDISRELTTPTGAAIVATLVDGDSFTLPSNFTVGRVGHGAGSRDLQIPNMLRAILGEISGRSPSYLELVTNIDDMNPELYSYLFTKLFTAGALDVYLQNIIMKKNRPGVKLSVICRGPDQKRIENLLLRETTTFGIRRYQFTRSELERTFDKVQTQHGDIVVKFGYLDGELIKGSPEYEDCKKIALATNIPLKNIYELAMVEASSLVKNKISSHPVATDNDLYDYNREIADNP